MNYPITPAPSAPIREPNGKWYFAHDAYTKQCAAVSPDGQRFVIHAEDASLQVFRLLEAMAVTITRAGL